MLDQLPLVRGVASLVSDGGPFVLSIFSAGVLMWALILERYYFFLRILPKQVAEAQAAWQARRDRTSWCARQIRTAMISRLNGSMTTGFPVMQVLVPMSPLLGLIGTVIGHARRCSTRWRYAAARTRAAWRAASRPP